MLPLSRLISRVPNYWRAFGILAGSKLLLRVERQFEKRSSEVRPYRIGWANDPIWLRDNVSDHSIFWQCMVLQQYDFQRFPQHARLRRTYDRMVAAGRRPVIIDCGGNIGLSAIWFALKFPKAQVFVLEPDQDNFALLTRNIAPYGDAIQPIKGGIWARPDQLTIANPEAGSAAFQVQAASGGERNAVRAYTVDEVLGLAGSADALIVKLDLEGSQQALFEANTDWVARSHLIILELDDWQFPWAGTSRPFFRCISQYPFDYLLGGEEIFCFQDLGEG
jgi:FkbM family methyltransferase